MNSTVLIFPWPSQNGNFLSNLCNRHTPSKGVRLSLSKGLTWSEDFNSSIFQTIKLLLPMYLPQTYPYILLFSRVKFHMTTFIESYKSVLVLSIGFPCGACSWSTYLKKLIQIMLTAQILYETHLTQKTQGPGPDQVLHHLWCCQISNPNRGQFTMIKHFHLSFNQSTTWLCALYPL